MKIVIVNGTGDADYIIDYFKTLRHKLIIINKDKEHAEYISLKYKIPVIHGDATKYFLLEEAKINNADLLITLAKEDTENYIVAMFAQKCFGVKKVISLVQNPKKVTLFKELGIDSVISSIYLLRESIKEESSIESVISTLTIKHDKVILLDLIVTEQMEISNKKIKDANLPANINIGAILRGEEVIIPYGDTLLLPHDHLYILTEAHIEHEILQMLTTKRHG